MTSGRLWSVACSMQRVRRSPTTLPMEPAMNVKSITPTTSLRPLMKPVPVWTPSISPLLRCVSLRRSM